MSAVVLALLLGLPIDVEPLTGMMAWEGEGRVDAHFATLVGPEAVPAQIAEKLAGLDKRIDRVEHEMERARVRGDAFVTRMLRRWPLRFETYREYSLDDHLVARRSVVGNEARNVAWNRYRSDADALVMSILRRRGPYGADVYRLVARLQRLVVDMREGWVALQERLSPFGTRCARLNTDWYEDSLERCASRAAERSDVDEIDRCLAVDPWLYTNWELHEIFAGAFVASPVLSAAPLAL